MRKLVGGIAIVAAVLVALGYLTGAEWVRLILGMFGVTA
jgi:hypothetical protein